MSKDVYHRKIEIGDLDPCFLCLIRYYKLDMYRTSKTPIEQNLVFILREEIGKVLGLDYSLSYLDLTKGITIDEENKLVLMLTNIPADQVDIKPSELRTIIEKVVEDVGNRFEVKKPYKTQRT
jgi:hypothetical protein